MKRTQLVLILLTSLFATVCAQNPIADFYGAEAGYPGWTDAIQWENQIDMSQFSDGENDFEKFENARDILFKEGGGVLYYPSGTYDFSDLKSGRNGRGLMLKSGVVILGERPTGDDRAADGTMELPTKFVFPLQNVGTTEDPKLVPNHWNLVGITVGFGQELKEVDDVGIAWVHLDGAIVYFGPQLTWGDNYSTAGAFRSSKVYGEFEYRKPNGRFPLDPFCGAPMNTSVYEGAGTGRFVFGCIIDNATMHNDFIDDGFGEEGFFNYKFIARIGVYGSKVFIANNLLPRPTRSFLYEQNTSEGLKTIMYDYGFSTGIDVNKNHLNVTSNKLEASGGYWEEGVIIKDNWVYNHVFKGLDISGTWMTVQGNTNEHDLVVPGSDIYGLEEGWTPTANGYVTHLHNGSGDAFQNRAFDVAGKAVWIDQNEYWGVGTPKPSNDGEGILCQAHGGTQMHSWVLTRNTGRDDGRGYGYMAGWDVDNLGVMMAWNNSPASLGAFKVSSREMIDVSFVANQVADKVSSPCGSMTSCDTMTVCPDGTPLPPLNVFADPEDTKGYIDVSWEDASDNEIGFRVDRRVGGSEVWIPIAYRPRHSMGHADNEQKWRDFNAASGVAYEYRVLAINCDDGDEGAAMAQAPVKVITRVENPVAFPVTGSYDNQVKVGLSTPTFGAKIRYTLDGSMPTENSVVYEDSIAISETSTLRYKAYRNGISASYPMEEVYTIIDHTSVKEELSELPFMLYPVPVTGMLHLKTRQDLESSKLLIISLDGRVIYKNTSLSITKGEVYSFPAPERAGSYILKLESPNQVYSKIFVVE